MDEIDIWRAANVIVQCHGTMAEVIAARRIQAMTERGDEAGKDTWLRIITAVKTLRRTTREAGKALQ
jgi:hypothetical protein